MCKDAYRSDLVSSRFRWYDVPAFLLFHRPVRCRICNRRYLVYRSMDENKASHALLSSFKTTTVSKNWSIYLTLSIMVIVGFSLAYPQSLEIIQTTITKVFKNTITL